MGNKAFWHMVVTKPCNRGSECMDAQDIERSCYARMSGTRLHFAHPYTACESSSNENHTRMLRCYFPKGTDFSLISNMHAQPVSLMNKSPQKMLLGYTPNNALEKLYFDSFVRN